MENCAMKYLLIFICILIILTGLYLAFIREKVNIKTNRPDIMEAETDLSGKKLSFKFAIGLVLILIGLIGAIYIAINLNCDKDSSRIESQQETTANLRFKLDGNDSTQTIYFMPRLPKWREGKYVARQGKRQDDYHFLIENIDLPKAKDLFFAKIQLERTTPGTYSESAVVEPIDIRFVRKKENTIPEDKCIGVIKYCKNHKLLLDEGDEGHILLEDSNKFSLVNSFNFFPSAFAQSNTMQKTYSGWTVPSLYTLNRQKVLGFSQIIINSTSLFEGLKNSNRYSYLIKVNNVPMYIDGLLPEDLMKSFSYANGLNLEFGLENLGFSGINNGYEKIEIKLNFYRDSQLLKSIALVLDFVALRKLETKMISADDGSLFKWEAYFKANKENQIFILSTPNSEEVKRAKNKIDSRNLFFKNQKIVGVIRPPYKNNRNYGLNVGVVLTSGQTKFTFNNNDANQLTTYLVTNGYKNPTKRVLKDN